MLADVAEGRGLAVLLVRATGLGLPHLHPHRLTAPPHPPVLPQSGSTAAKYAACLALFAADPEPRNRAYALRTLRDFTAQRRRAVAALAARAAAARGGAGGADGAPGGGATLLHEMPDFLLAFLVFLLAHHPDYPTQEVSAGLLPAAAGRGGGGRRACWARLPWSCVSQRHGLVHARPAHPPPVRRCWTSTRRRGRRSGRRCGAAAAPLRPLWR